MKKPAKVITALKPKPDRIYTIVRLAYGATLQRACDLAGIVPSQVTLTQKVGERAPDMTGDYRIISFDGQQMTISERIQGERSVRGFAVEDPATKKEGPAEKPLPPPK